MNHIKFASMLLMVMILAGCGGGDSDVPSKPRFSAQVSFGDSLSDVGSYKVGPILAAGGGQFTINAASGVPATPTNWTEFTAPQLGLAAPCAAVTGGFGVTRNPAVSGSIPGCYAYGQGGARVTLQPGVGNIGAGGPMTEPVATQIANHLATNGNFKGDEIVFVMAGANDVFTQAGLVGATAITPASGVVAVQTAADQLAADVKTQIIGNGAKYVVVINVPDIASTPYGVSLGSSQGFIDTLVTTFNGQLKADLPDSANVLNVDAYSASHDEVANPGKYLLSNVTIPSCNIASSLTCTSATLNTGVDSHYLFADAVHPTPYGHSLFSLYVLKAMTNKGWY